MRAVLESKEALAAILEDIKDKVIVTGSYAYGEQTPSSDIDMFIREIPEDKIVWGENGPVAETYCEELIDYFEKLGYKWDSLFVSSFSVDDTFIPLEFSAYFSIDESRTFEIEILGVKMVAAKSTHTSDKYLNGRKRSRVTCE